MHLSVCSFTLLETRGNTEQKFARKRKFSPRGLRIIVPEKRGKKPTAVTGSSKRKISHCASKYRYCMFGGVEGKGEGGRLPRASTLRCTFILCIRRESSRLCTLSHRDGHTERSHEHRSSILPDTPERRTMELRVSPSVCMIILGYKFRSGDPLTRLYTPKKFRADASRGRPTITTDA